MARQNEVEEERISLVKVLLSSSILHKILYIINIENAVCKLFSAWRLLFFSHSVSSFWLSSTYF